MAGLLKSAMAGAPEGEKVEEQGEPLEGAPEGAAEGEAGEQGDLSPAGVRAKMNLPDNLKGAYDRVVLAGMKVMFSPETHQQAMSFLSEENGPADQRIGQGVAALMGLLIKQSNNTMPPQVVIPAGIELVAAAGDFLKQSGDQVTDDDIAGAMAEYTQIVLQQAGGDSPEKLRQMLQQAGGGVPEGAPSASAPPQGEAPPQEAPAPGGGMINQAMKG
jgi:hypothetical protein